MTDVRPAAHGEDPGDDGRRDPTPSRAAWIFGILAIVAAVFLLAEHRAHVLGILPWIVVLACPLMHIFMHGGHGHGVHGRHGHGNDAEPRDERTAPREGPGG